MRLIILVARESWQPVITWQNTKCQQEESEVGETASTCCIMEARHRCSKQGQCAL